MDDEIEFFYQTHARTETLVEIEPNELRRRLKFVSGMLRKWGKAAGYPVLIYRRGDSGELVEVPLASNNVIGRAQTADCSVECSLISSAHFRISMEEDGSGWISDLGSKNGTLINQAELREAKALVSGDVIEAGSVAFVFLTPG